MQILSPNCYLEYVPNWLSQTDADRFFTQLYETIEWEVGEVFVFGRWHTTPRLQAWYGDANKSYRYSGKALVAKPWTDALVELRQRLKERGFDFNSVLLNLYRDGEDRMGWHRDNEPELGDKPVIASISLGAERDFQLRHRQDKSKHTLTLGHGSLLLMTGETQTYWEHQLPQRKRCRSPRLNLTFRKVF
ncbi:MAG: alpha-ketoglutarate-dependent dioxygenase AlkB [Aliidiomarina sp.]|uniref:alpha-ketoglutarate-dependent dioxygenase AlkB family protein n=1 Tax=Aliidiomarina sp. TaxID=1872439 RepID=UPI0025BEF9F3|nr:alpha-ketoglutarate-dependent dioxygenase AlkB [Aliidiomarina sp.]MCH8501378.1 alpha-ketoglutarate-dependent dioxygenase AlkB [Aliidiomarina sp.]